MSRIVYKSNGGAIGDGIRITRVSGGGQRLEVLVDTVAERWSEVVLVADAPAPMPQPDPDPVPEPDPDPVPVPDPVPDPTPVPPAPPAQPKPPATAYDAVAALKAKVTEVQHPKGHMVTQTLVDVSAMPSIDGGASIPADVTVSATEVTLGGKFVGDFRMHIGDRQLTLAAGADVGIVQVFGRAPSGKIAGISIKTGARLRSLNGSILDGSLGISKALHQEHTGTGPTARIGSLDEIVDCQIINQQGDGPKVAGSEYGPCRIVGNLFGQQESGYAGAHYDQTTIMAAHGGMVIRGNLYDNQIDTDTVGVNNWLQFAPYWPGALYDDIDVEGNIFIHRNDRSFGFAKGSNHPGTWNGKIRINRNWFDKAGGPRKIFYAGNNFADEWIGNIDLSTGAVI